MKTRAKGLFTVSLVSVTLGMPAAMGATTVQVTFPTETRTLTEGGTRPSTGQLKVARNSAIARNSTAKTEIVKTDASATSAKEQDKKTMSRCWKRLMTMARELNHAHRSKNK